MAFSEIELKRIEIEVGGFCERMAPIEIRNKLNFEYRIKAHDIIIYTQRPRWDNPKEWIESDMAKMKYVRTSNMWRLFWQRANGKWVIYEPFPQSKNLKSIVEKIEKDQYGCFFG
jgi:hypothetical protein